MLVDAIHGARGRCAAIVINPGAFTPLRRTRSPTRSPTYDGVKVELHLSNPAAREEWRRTSVDRARRSPARSPGSARTGYRLAIEAAVAAALERRVTVVALDALPAMDVAGRRRPAARARFADAGIDALLVTRLANVRYLTGFTGSSRDGARHHRRARCSPPTVGTAPGGRAARRGRRRRASWRSAQPSRSSATRSPRRWRPRLRTRARGARGDLGPAARPAPMRSPATSSCPPTGWSSGLRRVKEAG